MIYDANAINLLPTAFNTFILPVIKSFFPFFLSFFLFPIKNKSKIFVKEKLSYRVTNNLSVNGKNKLER